VENSAPKSKDRKRGSDEVMRNCMRERLQGYDNLKSEFLHA